jgi:hypothetical protein
MGKIHFRIVAMTNSPRYLAYMLRLWQVDRQGQPEWRASLESPHTGERLGFADVAQLLAFLQEKTDTRPLDNENDNDEP